MKMKNTLGWTVLAEAVSYGHRPTSMSLRGVSSNVDREFVSVSSLVRKFRQQSREQMEKRRPYLVEALRGIGDFYMELKWDFQSWGEF